MTVATSARFNLDTLQAALPSGAAFSTTGADPTVAAPKVVTFYGTDDTTGQGAITAAAGQFTDRIANQATIQANIATHIGQLEAWMTANPNGAVLNAAQTKFVAQTLVGVGRLLLNLTSTVGGAT